MKEEKTKKWFEKGGDKWYMAGTEGTGAYMVLAANVKVGRVGVREFETGYFRVRVEPVNQTAVDAMKQAFVGWKEPDGMQFRFSTVKGSTGDKVEAVKLAFKSLGVKPKDMNPKAPAWAKKLFEAKVAEKKPAVKKVAVKKPAKKAMVKKAAPKKLAKKK